MYTDEALHYLHTERCDARGRFPRGKGFPWGILRQEMGLGIFSGQVS